MKRTIDECFFHIQNGANIKQGQIDGGFPITRIETISNNTFNRDRMGYAGITDVSKYKSYVLEDGDLLMSHINSAQYLGRTVLYEKRNDETIIHGMNLLRLKARSNIILPSFARYCFYGRIFKSQIATITKKSVNQASFAVKDLKQIQIDVPPIVEQNKIVHRLDTISHLIERENIQLAKLDTLVKSRFIEMFGDPVTNPMGWERDLLKNLGELNRGVSKHRPRNAPELLNGPYPLVQTGDVSNADTYITDYSSTYSELGLKQSRMWSKGTLCITIAANIAKTGILAFDACFPDSVVGFIAGKRSNQRYIHHWFSFFQKILEEQAPQSAQKNINLQILSNLSVTVPPIALQNQFAAFVQQVDKSKSVLQKLLEKQELLRAALMQEYFG